MRSAPASALSFMLLLTSLLPAARAEETKRTGSEPDSHLSLTPAASSGEEPRRGRGSTGKVTPGLGAASLSGGSLQLSSGLSGTSKGPTADEEWRNLFPKKTPSRP